MGKFSDVRALCVAVPAPVDVCIFNEGLAKSGLRKFGVTLSAARPWNVQAWIKRTILGCPGPAAADSTVALFQWVGRFGNLIAIILSSLPPLIRYREFGLIASDRSGELVALPWWVGFSTLRP